MGKTIDLSDLVNLNYVEADNGQGAIEVPCIYFQTRAGDG